jgi:hypothetical protein
LANAKYIETSNGQNNMATGSCIFKENTNVINIDVKIKLTASKSTAGNESQ